MKEIVKNVEMIVGVWSVQMDDLRKDFPIFENGTIYFDNACMSLKPKPVIRKVLEYYEDYGSCGGRSSHSVSGKVDKEVENSRKLVRKFIGANKDEEIIFTKNATESINFLSKGWKFDKVLVSDREHNSNLLPWMKFNFNVLKSKEDFSFDLEKFQEEVKNVDFVSLVWTSNFDGYTLPVKEIVKIAHENNVKVHLDAAQAVPHREVNVKSLGVDFLSFSGHKMLGPTGTGVLFVKKELQDDLKPFILGGGTVSDSKYDSFNLEKSPMKFEAGLQNYAGIIGLGEAVKYLQKIGMENIEKHEIELREMVGTEGLEIVGYKGKTGIFNFNIPKMDPHEVAMILDSSKKIMVRSGAHCAHSWYNAHNLKGSVRASFYFYNTKEEVETFNEEVRKLLRFH